MPRIHGNSETKVFRPAVKLITSTKNPVGTLVSLWIGSRYEYSLDPDDIQDIYEGCSGLHIESVLKDCYPEYDNPIDIITHVANMVIKSGLPPLDSLVYTFEIDNANVAWREQLVRGRQPQNFWMQTSRTADLSKIDVNRSENVEYYGGQEAVDIYNKAVQSIRDAYTKLSILGVPVEDIRLVPQGMLHRVYWIVPYRTLKNTLSKRLSWIAQASLWSPIVEDVITEVRKDCNLLANDLGVPSDVTIIDNKVSSHTYDNENYDRYYGRDPQPCDPLWLAYHNYSMPDHTNIEFYDRMKSYYIKLWNDEVLHILGWDRSNPSRLGFYDRPKSKLL